MTDDWKVAGSACNELKTLYSIRSTLYDVKGFLEKIKVINEGWFFSNTATYVAISNLITFAYDIMAMFFKADMSHVYTKWFGSLDAKILAIYSAGGAITAKQKDNLLTKLTQSIIDVDASIKMQKELYWQNASVSRVVYDSCSLM